MALFDYHCDECGKTYQDVYQPIGSDQKPKCPSGHRWKRLIVAVTIDHHWGVMGSTSPKIEEFWETGDAEAAGL